MKQLIFTIILVFGFGFSVFAQTEKSNCPTIDVSGGGVVQPGESMTFTANVTGLTKNSALEYEWTVSNGTISSGQGMPSITIDTTGLAGNTEITAEVKIEGFPENCPNTASSNGTVFRGGHPRLFDEFGKLSNNDAAARIQNIYVELENNTDLQAYIIIYGTDREFAARELQIQSAIRRLKFDSSRIKIINGGANRRGKGVWTQVYFFPQGTDISPLRNN